MKKEDPNRINQRITAPVVRLVGENVESGIFQLRDALNLAEDLGLDLVEISASASPPVCKIMDYKKFLFEQKKKQKEMKAKTAKVL